MRFLLRFGRGLDYQLGIKRALLCLATVALGFGACDRSDKTEANQSPGSDDGASGDGDGGGSEGDGDEWTEGGDGDGDSPAPLYGEGGTPPEDLKLVFKKLSVPDSNGGTDFAFLPNARELLMVLRDNRLLHLQLDGEEINLLLSWSFDGSVLTDKACGPTNILLDPDFQENSFIYTSFCVDAQVTRIMRYTWSSLVGPTNGKVIFETTIATDDARDEWHRFGSMGFEDDGVLWFLHGDHFLEERAQDFSNSYGTLQRIIPNREVDGDGHTYPSGNMVLGMGGPMSDIVPDEGTYAFGLRSPWRGTRDSLGRYWVGDVGLGEVEEVNLVTEVGQNFGWATHEGPCRSDCDDLTDPIAHYTRDEEHAYFREDSETVADIKRAIWVGEMYEDPAVDRYEGMMDAVVPFGDLFTGWVRGLRADADNNITMDKSIGNLEGVVSWKLGPDGYAYALDLGGQLYVALLDYEG